ncbi:MAG: universal stress protein [Actinomycetota bacterium]|nr:universal stress protein [Actinomycetota bacterium]
MSQQPGAPRAPRIVVGVDGSPSSEGALRWAARQAGLTGATVEAVMAWHMPLMISGYAWPPVGVLEATDFGKAAQTALSAATVRALGADSPAPVIEVVKQGPPPRVLLDAAAGADLLVVGSRGHGGFTEALLGSVSQHCVHHAPCPVVVIRDAAAGT